jgi:hypothetical protein
VDGLKGFGKLLNNIYSEGISDEITEIPVSLIVNFQITDQSLVPSEFVALTRQKYFTPKPRKFGRTTKGVFDKVESITILLKFVSVDNCNLNEVAYPLLSHNKVGFCNWFIELLSGRNNVGTAAIERIT